MQAPPRLDIMCIIGQLVRAGAVGVRTGVYFMLQMTSVWTVSPLVTTAGPSARQGPGPVPGPTNPNPGDVAAR